MNQNSFIFVLLALSFSVNNASKILAIFPSPGFSQYILGEPLFITLAQKGHEVTVISAYESRNVSDLHNIVIDMSDLNSEPELLFELQDKNIFANIIILHQLGLAISEKILSNNKVQELIRSKEKYDLVLVETFFSEALQAFAKHFDAHLVLFHSQAVNEWNSNLVGNPFLPSYSPTSFVGYTNHMNFLERCRNTLSFCFDRLYKYLVYYPRHQNLVDQYFPKYNLEDIIYNASLMLTCSHVSTTDSLSITNSIVEVGGLHIRNKTLPKEINDFLNSAKNGAIFFSMGSNVKSSSFPKDIIRSIISAVGKLEQKVLWKFEDEGLENIPENLMVSKWLPQSDILAHPNTVLFISHCGLGSTTEAVYYGVPVVGIPIYGDQFMNIRRLVEFGMGVELLYKDLSGESFELSIKEMLNNPTYKENAQRRSDIMRDRPIKPLDLATYSIEYVLRHKGAHHLKSSNLDLRWYQLYLIDVIAVLVAISLGVVVIVITLLRILKKTKASKKKVE